VDQCWTLLFSSDGDYRFTGSDGTTIIGYGEAGGIIIGR
jgi:hypothetical protein